jgi:hypothetical protein
MTRTKPVPPYEVIRVGVVPAAVQPDHDHVNYVVTADPDGGETRWPIDEVISAIRAGETFATVVKTGRGSFVTIDTCPTCRLMTLVVDRSLVRTVRTAQP